MELINTKKWIYLGFGALLILGLRWINMHWVLTTPRSDSSGFSYEMPRPTAYAGSFDLSGREIDREVLKDEEKIAIVDKAVETKKSEATKDAAKKATAKKEADKKAQAQRDLERKKKFDVSTIEAAGRTPFSVASNEATNNYSSEGTGFLPQNRVKTTSGNKEQDSNEPKHSASEWRALLNSQPTNQLAAEFITAHQKGDIADKDFYTNTFELFVDQNSARHSVGVYILSADNSTVGFVYMATEYGKMNEQSRAALWTIMLGYGQPQRFRALSGAISSKDSVVVTLALQVLSAAVQNQKQQLAAQPSEGNPNRGVAGSAQPQAFQIFIVPLTQIAKSNDVNNSPIAQSLIVDIQAMVKN